MYHIFFIHSSVAAPLGCFRVLAIVNSAVMNTEVHVSFQTMFSSGYMPRNMQGKKQQLERDMEQQTGSKLGKEYVKAIYCHPDYLTYMQSTSCKMLGWMKHKLKSTLPGEISITSDTQMTPPLWQKAKRN